MRAPQTDGPDVAAIVAAERERCEAIGNDDFERAERFLGDELTYLHSSGAREDRSEFAAGLRSVHRTFRTEPREVRLYGDVAVVIGTYTVTVEARDGSFSPRSVDANSLQVWVKRDGRWMLTAHHGSPQVVRP